MTIGLVSAQTPAEAPVNTAALKSTGAAKDFEALLLTQMLHSVREEASGWLGSGPDQTGDQSSDAAFGLGEEELAKAMAASGGLGIARLINQGLNNQR